MAARHTELGSDDMARGARKAGDQAMRSAQTLSDATERAMRSGAETAERNSERFLSSWRTGSDTANRIAERSVTQFTRIFGLSGETASQTLQRSSGNLQAVLETTSIIADGLQDLSGELTQFVQSQTEHQLELLDKAFACRNPHELMALQAQMARDHFEAFLQAAKRASERTTQVTDRAVRKMAESTLAPERAA